MIESKSIYRSYKFLHVIKYAACVYAFTTLVLSCTHKTSHTQLLTSNSGTAIFNNVLSKAQQIDQTGNYKEALRYLDSAYNAIKPTDFADQYQYYYSLFNIYNRHLHQHDIAGHYADTMLMLVEKNYKKQPLEKEYALANFSKGDACYGQGDYSDAYVYYYKAWTLAENNLDSCELQDYNYRLGMVLYNQQRYKEAANDFKLAFRQSQNCEHTFSLFYRRQELLDNAALAYSHIKAYDSALLYYHKALDYINQHSNEFLESTVAMQEQGRAVIYGNMASVLMETGKTKEAEDLLRESIRINSQKNYDNMDAQLTRLKLASLYFDKGDIPSTYKLLQDIKVILDTLPGKRVALGWYSMMSKYYDHEKQPVKAYEFLLKYNNLDEVMEEQNIALGETDIAERIKNLDKQYQISILRKNNELKKYYLIITSLITIICLTVALFVFFNWRRSRKNVKTLTTFNDQIHEQNTQLEQVLAELEDSNNQKDRILRTVAHDIRNPIAAISSLSDLLLADYDNYSDEQKEMLYLMQNACSDALTLAKDILDAAEPARVETLQKEWTDINALLSNGVHLLQFRAAEKHQKIELKLLPAKRLLFINKEKIWRVISNLVTNAIKFSPDGATIQVTATEQDGNIRICVHDNGIGIPDTIKDRVFDTFTEAKRTGTAGEKSFGLGLSISRHIVEMHGGRVWFESNANKGTTFYIILPISDK